MALRGPQHTNRDLYADGWQAGLEQARRILQRADDVHQALDRIYDLLAESHANRAETRKIRW